MQKYAADRADGLTENIAFYWEVGDLLVPLHYNHVLLLQCVCNPADEPAVKVKDSIIEMNMAHVIFDFLYYDIPGPGRYAVIPTDIKFREFGFQIAGALYSLYHKCTVIPGSMYRGLPVRCRSCRDKSRDLPFHPEPKNILIP